MMDHQSTCKTGGREVQQSPVPAIKLSSAPGWTITLPRIRLEGMAMRLILISAANIMDNRGPSRCKTSLFHVNSFHPISQWPLDTVRVHFIFSIRFNQLVPPLSRRG
jgi:hypothetical protein